MYDDDAYHKDFIKRIKDFKKKFQQAQTEPGGMLRLYMENEIKLCELFLEGASKLDLKNRIIENHSLMDPSKRDKFVRDKLDELGGCFPPESPSLYIKENLEKALSKSYGLEISSPLIQALLEIIMDKLESK